MRRSLSRRIEAGTRATPGCTAHARTDAYAGFFRLSPTVRGGSHQGWKPCAGGLNAAFPGRRATVQRGTVPYLRLATGGRGCDCGSLGTLGAACPFGHKAGARPRRIPRCGGNFLLDLDSFNAMLILAIDPENDGHPDLVEAP